MYDNHDLGFESEGASSLSLKQYAVKTFTMMALGLLITTITAVLLLVSGFAYRFALMGMAPSVILLVAQIGVVMAFSSRLFKASLSSTRMMFFLYSILTGVTFSIIGLIYQPGTIALAFGITVVYFGSLVVIGATMKLDLTRFAPIFMVGLVILIIFNIVGMIINLDSMSTLICSGGLLLFTGLTAYDAQKMKKMYMQYQGNEDMLSRLSMYSALELYLDFINIFLYILRLLGNRK